MSIKAMTLAAAALVATTTAASALSFFELPRAQSDNTVLELGTVSADRAGIIEVYDFHTGEQGALLGSIAVNAGATGDVRINTATPLNNAAIAVLKVDGETVASEIYHVTGR